MRNNMLQTIIIFMAIATISYGFLSALFKETVVEITFEDSASEYELIGDMLISDEEDLGKPFKFKGVKGEKGKLICGFESWSFTTPDPIYVQLPDTKKVVPAESVTADFVTGTVSNNAGEEWLSIDNIQQMPSTTDMSFTVLNGELPYTAQLYVEDELRAECGAVYAMEEDGSVKKGVYSFESWPPEDRHVYVVFLSKLVDVDKTEMTCSSEGKTVITVK